MERLAAMSKKQISMSLLHYSSFQKVSRLLTGHRSALQGGKGADFELPVCVHEAHNRILMALGWDTWEKRYAKGHLNFLQQHHLKPSGRNRSSKTEKLWMNQWGGIRVFPQLCSIRREEIPMWECEMWEYRSFMKQSAKLKVVISLCLQTRQMFEYLQWHRCELPGSDQRAAAMALGEKKKLIASALGSDYMHRYPFPKSYCAWLRRQLTRGKMTDIFKI